MTYEHPFDRRGRVEMTEEFLRTAAVEKLNPLDHFVVLHAEYQLHRRVLVLIGYHPSFSVLAEGEAVPGYVGTFWNGRKVPYWTRVGFHAETPARKPFGLS